MPSIIPIISTVRPFLVNDVSGEKCPYHEEVGTPDFYMISDTLKKHLGEKCNISKDKENYELFTIENIDTKLKIEEIKKIIKNINELNTLCPQLKIEFPSSHITFEMIE